jgi:hypothetical protein
VGVVTLDSIREQGMMYYCHKNKEENSAKELRCVTRVGGGGIDIRGY